MYIIWYKRSGGRLLTFFLMALTCCFFISVCLFPTSVFAASDEPTGWIEVQAEVPETLKSANIRYIWVMLSRDGIDHVIELLSENGYTYKDMLEPGEYTLESVSVVSDKEIDYKADAPETLKVTRDKLARLNVIIEETAGFSSPAAKPPSKPPSEQPDPEPGNKNSGSVPTPKSSPFSGIFTLVIFLILCGIMLYFKFRKENTND